jgi:type II secretory pathway pseudopilin PulG
MMKKYRKRTGGFTFVEIMIVLAVFIVIGGSLAYILSSGEEAWYMSDAGIVASQEGRRAMSAVIREIRQSSPSVITNCPADGLWRLAQINFSIPFDIDNDGDVIDLSETIEWNPVTYVATGQAQLERQDGNTNTVLCNNLMRVYFRRQAAAPDVVEVALWTAKWTRHRSEFGWMAAQVFSCNIKMRN